ncbi:hypothetical protein KA119_02005 [Candidatus Gracilibacteria bacterium]|nr:hypothetical protein [Candidatus Gracilibacteria bacterium]
MLKRTSSENTIFKLGPRVVFDGVVKENPNALAEINQHIALDVQYMKDGIVNALKILIDADKNRIGRDVNLSKGISGAIYEQLLMYLNGTARSDSSPIIWKSTHQNHLHMAFQRNVLGLEILIPPRAKMAVQTDYLARYYMDTVDAEKRVAENVRRFIKDNVLTQLEKRA